MLSEITGSIVEMSDAGELNNIIIGASRRSIPLYAREPAKKREEERPPKEPGENLAQATGNHEKPRNIPIMRDLRFSSAQSSPDSDGFFYLI